MRLCMWRRNVFGESNSRLLEVCCTTQRVWLKLARGTPCFRIETAVFGRESRICERAVAAGICGRNGGLVFA